MAAKHRPSRLATVAHGGAEGVLHLLLVCAPLVFLWGHYNLSNLPKETLIQGLAWLGLAWWLGAGAVAGRLALPWHPLLIPILLGLAWSGLSLFWAPDPWAGRVVWLHWLSASAAGYLALAVGREAGAARRLLGSLALGGAAAAGLGLAQYVLGWEGIPQAVPPAITFVNKNVAAQYLVMVLPAALYWLRRGRGGWPTWAGAAAVLAITFMIVAGRTRGAWAAWLVSLAWLAWRAAPPGRGLGGLWAWLGGRRLALGLGAVVLTVALVLALEGHWSGRGSFHDGQAGLGRAATELLNLSGHGGGMGIRLRVWANCLPMVAEHPLRGVGLGGWFFTYPLFQSRLVDDPNFGEQFQAERPHNDYLHLLTETGFPGLAILAAGMALFWLACRRLRAGKEDDRWLGAAAGAGLVALATHALVSFPLRMALPPLLALVLMGLVMARDGGALRGGEGRLGGLARALTGLAAAGSLALAVGLTAVNLERLEADRGYFDYMVSARAGDWPRALASAGRAVAANPHVYRYWFAQGRAAARTGRLELADRSYERALAIHPYHANTMVNLGSLRQGQGRLAEAAALHQRALRLVPGFAKALYNLGLVRERQGRLAEARELFAQTLAADPALALAHGRLGVLAQRSGDNDLALKHLERAAAAPGAQPEPLLVLGVLYQRAGRLEEAAAVFQRLAQGGPFAAEALNQLGLIMAQGGRWDRAVALYQRAVKLKPNLGPARANLAYALIQTGDLPAARRQAREAQRLGLVQGAQLLDAIERLRGGRSPAQPPPGRP